MGYPPAVAVGVSIAGAAAAPFTAGISAAAAALINWIGSWFSTSYTQDGWVLGPKGTVIAATSPKFDSREEAERWAQQHWEEIIRFGMQTLMAMPPKKRLKALVTAAPKAKMIHSIFGG